MPTSTGSCNHMWTKIKNHFRDLGFTNRLALYILFLLTAGLGGGFYLAVTCIHQGFTSSLACWTVVFTPMSTALSVVLSKVVDKNKAENCGADGEGVKYAEAKASGFTGSNNSPAI